MFLASCTSRSPSGRSSSRSGTRAAVTPRSAISTLSSAQRRMIDSDTQWQYGMAARRKLPWGTEAGVGANVARYPSYIDEPWRSGVKEMLGERPPM